MNAFTLLPRTFSAWNDHDATTISAALAFYSILSLAPLIILAVPFLAIVFGHSTAREQILAQVQAVMGYEGAEAVRAMLEQPQKPSSGIVATIIGIVTLLFGASGVFIELRSALNTMWDVKPQEGGAIARLVRERLVTFGMVLAVGFLLLVLLTASAATDALGKFASGFLPAPAILVTIVNRVVSFAGIAILFGLIFRYVPETSVAWKDVWLGAVVTSLLFAAGKFLIGLYLSKAVPGSAYGAAGSLIAVILWIYYSSMIFLFGAEFTHQLAAVRGANWQRNKL
jgi:membrane protein